MTNEVQDLKGKEGMKVGGLTRPYSMVLKNSNLYLSIIDYDSLRVIKDLNRRLRTNSDELCLADTH